MPNPTVVPIMPPATGPGGPFANPVYLVDQYGNPIIPTNGLPASQAGTWNVGSTGDYPVGATPITASSGNVAAAVATATLAQVAGKTTYITGFEVTGSGATAALVVIVTVTNTITGTMTYIYAAAAGVAVENTPLIVQFPKPIPANAPATTIVVSCPSLGTGNTNNAVTAHGYQL